MHYFAYGSNMSTERIRARIDSAERIGLATLTGHRFMFRQRGTDGSAKCDVCFTGVGEDVVLGVLFRIDPRHKPVLDRFEGLGSVYGDKEVVVECAGKHLRALTYYGLQPVANLAPYAWYKEHVLRGAIAAGMPEDYVTFIRSVAAMADSDPERHRREMSIYGE